MEEEERNPGLKSMGLYNDAGNFEGQIVWMYGIILLVQKPLRYKKNDRVSRLGLIENKYVVQFQLDRIQARENGICYWASEYSSITTTFLWH
jgi:hypothetical protein